MAARVSQTPQRKPRRDRRREVNRKKLVDGALKLVGAEGATALTVTRLTGSIGMDQAGFYAHFKNIDECEEAAAAAFTEYINSHMVPYGKLRRATDLPGAIDASEALLASWMKHPEWISLVRRSSGEQSALGAATRGLISEVRSDIAQGYHSLASASGIHKRHHDEIEMLAEFSVGHFLSALGQLRSGRRKNLRTVATTMTLANIDMVAGAFRRMRKRDKARSGARNK